MGAAEFGAFNGSETSPEHSASQPIVVRGAGANANWVTVPSNAASERVEAELAVQIEELSQAHLAAREDGIGLPLSRRGRAARAIRRII